MNPENLARRQRSFTLWPCVLLAAALLSACQPPPAAVVDRVKARAADPVSDVRNGATALLRKIERLAAPAAI